MKKELWFSLALGGIAAVSIVVSAQRTAPKWTGTITMWAQAYTPYSTQPNTRQFKAFREVADEYEKLRPGVKIQFAQFDSPDAYQAIRTKAAASELWDVFFSQYSALNDALPQGIAVNLAPYFKQKNPYVPAAASWAAAMNPSVITSTADGTGASYNVNGDWVGFSVFYNKDLFKKAGIASAPKTWAQLIAASQKLKAAGIPSAVGRPFYGWLQRYFLSDFYAKDYATFAGFDKKPGVSGIDEAVAIKKGLLSTSDPRFMSWWPIVKQWTNTWIPDYLTQPMFKDNQDFLDFVGGKAAMFYMGSWVVPDLKKNLPALGSFTFPRLTTSVSPYVTGANTASAVGGPGGAFQYAISTPRANKTMNESDKFEATLDWMHFFTATKNAERIINENGGFAPSFKGTTAAPGLESLAAQSQALPRSVGIEGLSGKIFTDMQRVFGLYLSGNIDISEATRQAQGVLDASVEDFVKNNKIDLEPYLK
jgi:raffinose/stachyose/melibiose transport system substrate-binding protein